MNYLVYRVEGESPIVILGIADSLETATKIVSEWHKKHYTDKNPSNPLFTIPSVSWTKDEPREDEPFGGYSCNTEFALYCATAYPLNALVGTQTLE